MKTKLLTRSAVFAALIFVLTLTGAMAPIGGGAYIHIGDAFIYVVSLFLPLPYAMLSAAVGGMFADIALGSAVYVIPTIIVKSLTVLFAKGIMRLAKTDIMKDILICLSGVITILGYFVAEFIMQAIGGTSILSALSVAASGMLYNFLQALASAVVFMIIAMPARKIYSKINKDV